MRLAAFGEEGAFLPREQAVALRPGAALALRLDSRLKTRQDRECRASHQFVHSAATPEVSAVLVA